MTEAGSKSDKWEIRFFSVVKFSANGL